MELQDLIDDCEKMKSVVLQHYHSRKREKNPGVLYNSLVKFLVSLNRCVDKTLEIANGERYNRWWTCLWDISGIEPEVNKQLFNKFKKIIHDSAMKETISWKLKYYLLTIVYLTKHSPDFAFQYLQVIILSLRRAIKFPDQMAYFRALLTLFEEHRLHYQEHMLEVIRYKFSDVTGINVIDPNLEQSNVDIHIRTVLNDFNRQCQPSVIIYSILCHQAHLQFKELFSPLTSGDFWVDFNLNDKSLTLNCQLSCLRNERPNTESEEYEQRTTEILTINFDNISRITEKFWGFQQSKRGSLLIFTLMKPCNYIYGSSRETVQSSNQLFLNIQEGDDLNKLLDILTEIFNIRFKRKHQRQALVTQQNASDTDDSDWFPNPLTGRTAPSRSALSSFGRSHLQENNSVKSPVSVAYKEMLSFIRSGSTLRQVHQIQTEIHAPALNDGHNSLGNELNSDNWTANNTSNNRMLHPNQNPTRSRLSLMTANDRDESMTENSQEISSRTINTLEEKLSRTMDKYNPQPYKPELSTSLLDNKENQPDNISQGHQSFCSSAASDVLSSIVNNADWRKSRKEQEVIIDTIDLVSSDSDVATPVATNIPNTQVNDRLRVIIVQSDDDNDSHDNSDIIAGNLRNRFNAKSRSLVKKSPALQQKSQDPEIRVQQHVMTPNRNNTGSAERPRQLVAEEQSHVSRSLLKKSVVQQETQDSSMEFQQAIMTPNRNSTCPIERPRQLVAEEQSHISRSLLKKSVVQQETQDSSLEFQQAIMTPNRNNTGLVERPRQLVAEEQSHISRSLLKKSVVQQETQDSSMEFQQVVMTPNRNSTCPTERPRELVAEEQSQVSQETVSSSAEFQQRNPRTTANNPIETLPEYQPGHMATTQSQNTVIDLTQASSSVDFQPRLAKRSRPNENSENEDPNQKPNLSHKLLPSDPSEMYEKHERERVLSNAELPNCQAFNFSVAPTSQNRNITDRQASVPTSQALPNSAECDVLSASVQNSSTPAAVNSVSQQPLYVGTQDSMNNTPANITPLSEISIRSARSCVSVSPSYQIFDINNTTNENRLEQFTRRLDTEFDKIRYDLPLAPPNIDNDENSDDRSGELVIDLNRDAENLNVEHERDEVVNTTVDETINTTGDVQPEGVRRKRGRSKRSYAPEMDGNETINTTKCSTSSKRRKHREKKCKKHCDCDTLIDDLNYSRRLNDNLTAAQKEEEELKRLLRFSTRTRYTKPPIRLVDELNDSYLEKVQGQVERKRECGYCTDTVVYRKSSKRRTRHTDPVHPPRLSQTLNALDITEQENDREFESVIPERGTQSDVEHSDKHKNKKKKKSKRPRTEYDSSLIGDMSSIRLRLSRRNQTTCDLLTQESMTQDTTLACSQSQESQGWGAVFNKTNLHQPEAVYNSTNKTDASDWKIFGYFKNLLAMYKNFDKAIEELAECGSEEKKASVQLLYNEADSFIDAKQMKEKLKSKYEEFLYDD